MITETALVRQLLAGTKAVQPLVITKESYTAKQRETYLSRAALYNVVERTLTVMLAQLFAGEFEVSDSELKDVSPHQSTRDFIEELAEEILIGGRAGVLVDPRPDSKAVLKLFKTEQIVSTRVDKDGVLTRALLNEIVDTASEDSDYPQIGTRELRLFRQNGKYTVKVGGETMVVLVNGKSIDFIPFYIISYKGLAYTESRSPLQSLAELNLQHFRKQLSLSHALELVASPTTVIIGRNAVPGEKEVLLLGPEEVIPLPMGADAKFLELNADSISFLMQEIKNLEERMAFMGTQLLDSQKNVGQSGLAIELTHGGEKSVLASLSSTISDGASRFLTVFNQFCGKDSEVTVVLKLQSACALLLDQQRVSGNSKETQLKTQDIKEGNTGNPV